MSGLSFNNTGTVDLQAGTLALPAGTHTGDFTVASGKTLQFVGNQSFSSSSDITGAGSVDVTGGGTRTVAGIVNIGGTFSFSDSGTSTFSSTFTASTLSLLAGTATFNTTSPVSVVTGTMSAGTLAGSSDITITNTLAWTGGTMSGFGKTIIAAGGTLNMIKDTVSRNQILENDGTTNWTGGSVGMTNGTFNNNNVWVASGRSTMRCSGHGAEPSIMRAASPSRYGQRPLERTVFNNNGTVVFRRARSRSSR